MKPGIVITTRLNSRRIPRKALADIGGVPAIRLMYERLSTSRFPICFALSDVHEDTEIFEEINRNYTAEDTRFFYGHRDNVLARFLFAAEENRFDPIVRITHDDLLQDPKLIEMMVEHHVKEGADYTYIRDCLRGMDCEVVSKNLVQRAWKQHGDRPIEALSYAFKSPSFDPKISKFIPPSEYRSSARMSLDYPEDLDALRFLFRLASPTATGPELVQVIKTYPEILKINHQPKITVYTCAFNAEKTIGKAIDSVLAQGYTDFEYLLVDDGSYDKTASRMIAESKDRRIRLLHNEANLGLSTSCNLAMDEARGTYSIRLDADDELHPEALSALSRRMDFDPLLAAVYPAYRDSAGEIHDNKEHHMGGAMIRTSAWHELRFCDGLRHWEGKEFYDRLSKRFHVEHFAAPTWVYHLTPGSLSESKSEKRRLALELIGGVNSSTSMTI